jgi:hypothetical protein
MFSLAQMYLSIASDWSFAIGWTSLVSRILSVNRLLKTSVLRDRAHVVVCCNSNP